MYIGDVQRWLCKLQ